MIAISVDFIFVLPFPFVCRMHRNPGHFCRFFVPRDPHRQTKACNCEYVCNEMVGLARSNYYTKRGWKRGFEI